MLRLTYSIFFQQKPIKPFASATPNSYLLTPNFFQAYFQSFSCCDASLRYEGCFFFGSGSPKLASEQGGSEEETKGVALASQQGFYLFLLE